MILPEFILAIQANLSFWQEYVSQNSPANFGREHDNLRQAIEFGLRCPETQETAVALMLDAFSLIERYGYWQIWLPLYQQALSNSNLPPTQAIRLRNTVGYLYRLHREFDQAIHHHQLAIQHALVEEDSIILGRCYLNLGLDYHYQNKYDLALAPTQQALEIFDSVGPDAHQDLACAYNAIGLTYHYRGQQSESEMWLQKAVDLQRTLPKTLYLPRWLMGLAFAKQSQGHSDEALAYYHEAKTLLDQQENHLDRIDLQISLGSIYFARGDLDAAERHFREATAMIHHQPERTYHQAMTAYNLANVLLNQQQFAEAEERIRFCLPLWQKIGNAYWLASTWGVLGEIMLGSDDKEAAVSAFREGLACLPPESSIPRIEEVRQELIRLIHKWDTDEG